MSATTAPNRGIIVREGSCWGGGKGRECLPQQHPIKV